jgi:DNA-binding PadR family transcriptional regulator
MEILLCHYSALHFFEATPSEGYLELLATRDEPHGGRVTATYAITAKGREAVAFCDDESGPKKADWR